MLHTVNKSPTDKNTLESCIGHAKAGSAILLIEDGVYGALKDTQYSGKIEAAMKNVTIYVLSADVKARGIQDNIMDGIKLIGYDGFVDLTIEHDTVQSWL